MSDIVAIWIVGLFILAVVAILGLISMLYNYEFKSSKVEKHFKIRVTFITINVILILMSGILIYVMVNSISIPFKVSLIYVLLRTMALMFAIYTLYKIID